MEFVSSVVGRVVDSLFGVAIKEISYMWKCSENVENLKNEAENLEHMKGRVQQRINSAKDKGDLLLEGVEAWMKKADDNLSDATEFLNKEAQAKKTCLNLRLCVNLNTVHYYGRMAEKKKSLILQLQEEGKRFDPCDISLPAPPPRKNLENTQQSTLNKIIAAIEDDKLQIVGITGLGGVGKTTLASEVAACMKNQFSEIVFITVSQTVDSKMIQEGVQVAAKKIINREKVLIILDDVWEELKFDVLGIPCGSDYMNCKILLTSRSMEVCEKTNAQEIIPVNPLKEEEAWSLFERVVGKNVWDDNLKKVALQIVQECGGLPLFVQAVGKALKDREMNRWEIALRRLQDPTDEDAPFKRKGITQLKLSYDYLESEAAKSFFLMCSMFPEDKGIDMSDLTYYVMALGIFNNLLSIEDAKDRVQLVVDSLQSSFLLQKMERKSFYHRQTAQGTHIVSSHLKTEFFKMHDLVRDMALVITSKGNIKFMVESGIGLSEWQPREDIESYNKISLMDNIICKLPDLELNFPHLDTFLIQKNLLSIVPDEFFRGMEKLKVLDMSENHISFLPRSLKQLTELRTLNLSYNVSLCEISILGELTCLEILKLTRTGIEKIPEAIGHLTNLRVLDVYHSEHLSYVAPSVISKLIKLEELYVELKKDGNCHFLMELSELKSLKILYLRVPQLHYISEDLHVETLKEFHINEHSVDDNCHFRRVLYLQSETSFPFTKPIMKLIHVSEKIYMTHIKKLDSILPGFYPEGFEELKHITLMYCENVRSLVNSHELDAMRISHVVGPMKTRGKFFSQLKEMELRNLDRLEVLWDSPHQYISFSNLVEIYVRHCHSLLKLFPLSVAQGLVKLRRLYVIQCRNLEVVISAGDGDEKTGGSEIELVKHDTHSVFPLTYIRIRDLPKLESFYSGHSTIKYPSLDELHVTCCHSMKRWSYGENHIPKLKFEHEGSSYSNINDYITVQHEMNGMVKIHCREDKSGQE